MKNLNLFVAVSLLISSANAQITITSANSVPSVGEAFAYKAMTSPTVDVSPSGANQTWDFTSIVGVTTTNSYLSLSNGQSAASFPLANIVESTDNGSAESYYLSNSTEYTLHGHYIPGSALIIYSDKREHLKFPMTYNTVYNETFDGTVQNIQAGQTFDRSGTIEIKADAYGSIILPTGTVNDVLRVRSILNYTDEYMSTLIASYTDTIYMWFDGINNNYLASWSVGYANSSLFVFSASYMDNTLLDVNSTEAVTNLPSFYPNPADNYIFVKDAAQVESVSIYDLTGQLMGTIHLNGSDEQEIRIDDLNRGIYLLRYNVAGGEGYTNKLIVD